MSARAARLARAALAVLALVGLALALRHALSALGGAEGLIARAGVLGPLAVWLAQAALAPFPFPSELFTLASSAAYGWGVGAALTWSAWTAGSLLQYALVRRGILHAGLDARIARLPAWIRRVPLEHPAFLVAVRWLPMGFHVANVAAAARGVSVVKQLWTAALGSAPGAALWAGIGAGLVWLPV